jgi:lectin domain-containing protein
MSTFQVKNQWGGTTAPWHDGGIWVLGARADQNAVAVNINSTDGGKTFTGTMTYAGEGPIGCKATMTGVNTYKVENQWGGNTAPWHPGGTWVIGGRANQNVVQLNCESTDDGKSFTGTMTYAGEGPIGFTAMMTTSYVVQNQWGGNTAPWHDGGQWGIGGRENQLVVAMDIKSVDNGKTLTGTMTYAGEGPIGFRAKQTLCNTYAVENQWGGKDAPWHPGGNWLLGCRENQHVVQLQLNSTIGGKSLAGTMTYNGEGPIAFKGVLQNQMEPVA